MGGDICGAFILFAATLLLLAGKVLGHVDPDGQVKEAARDGVVSKIIGWLKK